MSLYVGVSPPCGDISEPFAQRQYPLREIYISGECSFDMNGVSTHPSYIPTGFFEPEISLYKENRIIEDIRDHVPSFDP